MTPVHFSRFIAEGENGHEAVMDTFGQQKDRRRQRAARAVLAGIGLAAAGYVGGAALSQPRPVVIEDLTRSQAPAQAAPPAAIQPLLGQAPAAASPPMRSKSEPPAVAVSINSATAQELESLPGIGPALAGRIIALRAQRGGFRSIEELDDVKGIGPATLAKFRGYLKL
jgi:competence protein ComEA